MDKDKWTMEFSKFDKLDNCNTLFNGCVNSLKAIKYLNCCYPYEMYILYIIVSCSAYCICNFKNDR